MNLPRPQDIRAFIASPCLIKTDRAGRALFISDFNKRAIDAGATRVRLESAGYICIDAGGMTLIDWTPARYAAIYEALPTVPLAMFSDDKAPMWGLCRILMQHPAPIEAQDIAILSQALRWARLKETDKLLNLLRAALSESLRQGHPPPYHATKLLSAIMSGQIEY